VSPIILKKMRCARFHWSFLRDAPRLTLPCARHAEILRFHRAACEQAVEKPPHPPQLRISACVRLVQTAQTKTGDRKDRPFRYAKRRYSTPRY
jgi:hypothetical protein